MRRREFIAGVAGAAAWTVAASSQQQPIVGLLSTRSAADSETVLAAFRKGLGEGGFIEGKNVRIEYRWANGLTEPLPAMAKDLVDRRVSVIAAVGGEPAIFPAKSATSTIPIVFVGGSDPVVSGLVPSLSRPGGNVTGVTLYSNSLEPKKLQLLRELVPNASTIAVLFNPKTPMAPVVRPTVEQAAASLGQDIAIIEASTPQEIESAFLAIVRRKLGALVVASNPFFSTAREKIITLAARHGIPAIYDSRIQVADGGLVSYGTSYVETYRQAGSYVARVLGGTKPADLPVLLPAKFELVINMKTAKALGLIVPLHLQQLADEVIE